MTCIDKLTSDIRHSILDCEILPSLVQGEDYGPDHCAQPAHDLTFYSASQLSHDIGGNPVGLKSAIAPSILLWQLQSPHLSCIVKIHKVVGCRRLRVTTLKRTPDTHAATIQKCRMRNFGSLALCEGGVNLFHVVLRQWLLHLLAKLCSTHAHILDLGPSAAGHAGMPGSLAGYATGCWAICSLRIGSTHRLTFGNEAPHMRTALPGEHFAATPDHIQAWDADFRKLRSPV